MVDTGFDDEASANPTTPRIAAFDYAYDAASNRTMRMNTSPIPGPGSREFIDEQFDYGVLDRLTLTRRGVRTAGLFGTIIRDDYSIIRDYSGDYSGQPPIWNGQDEEVRYGWLGDVPARAGTTRAIPFAPIVQFRLRSFHPRDGMMDDTSARAETGAAPPYGGAPGSARKCREAPRCAHWQVKFGLGA